MLSGGLSLYLSTPRADYLKGCFINVNCMEFVFLVATLTSNRGCGENGAAQGGD